MSAEQPLTGGNVAGVVSRAGDTVRKPWLASTPAVHAYLRHLEARGFRAAPRALGRDDTGRQVLQFVPGAEKWAWSPAELRRLGALVRELHDVSADFVPPPDARWTVAIPPDGADLVCHQDLAPWNLVVDGEAWVFIDWDASAPGTRGWDLAYVAQSFVPLLPGGDPAAEAAGLRALADGYALDEAARAALPGLIVRRTRAMHDLLANAARTGEQPWARMYAEGHGEHWRAAAAHVAAHEDRFRAALCGPRS